MPTSNSYDFTSTRDTIITAAFRKIGALGDYETLDTVRRDAGIAAINPMIKAYAAKGMPLWAITEKYIPFSTWTTSPTVTIGPGATINQPDKPLRVLQASRRDNSVVTQPVDVDLNIYTYDEYRSLANKNIPGTPIHFFYQPLAYTGAISLWNLPDTYWKTNGQLYIRYQRQFQDFDSSSDEPDFPVEWHEALIYNLAVRLAPEYGLSMNDRTMLKAEAKEYLEEALSNGTEEGSLYLYPDTRWK
jgi:hypothetical protein